MTATSMSTSRRRMPTWLVATIAGVFGLFYAYALWNAVAFLIAQASSTLGLSPLGWGVLLFAVLFPALVFAGALAIGMRRAAWEFALVLFAGLGLVAVFWINVLAYALTSGDSLISG